jgi:hypothetical protein
MAAKRDVGKSCGGHLRGGSLCPESETTEMIFIGGRAFRAKPPHKERTQEAYLQFRQVTAFS